MISDQTVSLDVIGYPGETQSTIIIIANNVHLPFISCVN